MVIGLCCASKPPAASETPAFVAQPPLSSPVSDTDLPNRSELELQAVLPFRYSAGESRLFLRQQRRRRARLPCPERRAFPASVAAIGQHAPVLSATLVICLADEELLQGGMLLRRFRVEA